MRRLNYDLAKEWDALDYPKGMGSGKVLQPPSPKYRRVYKFFSADHAISSIAFGRVKVSRIAEVNDPYEFLAFHAVGPMREALRAVKNEANKRQRLLCFSANWTSPVLWGHYADNHRGICLGFDLLGENAKTVTYRESRVRFVLPDGPMTEERKLAMANKLVRIKCDHWSHEQEIRALINVEHTVQEGSLDFLYLDSSLLLAEVVLGFQCSIALDKMRAFAQSKYPDMPVFCARLADKYFRMVPNEHTIPSTRK